MKFFTTTLLLAALCISSIGYSQNSKHSISSAKIVYRITQTTTKEVAIKPMEYTLFIKKDMSRVEMESEKGKMTMISDNLARTAYMLMDNSGSKIAMKMNLEAEMQKKGIDKDPEVEITRESKVIAGYTCYKAIIKSTTKGDKETYDVWFTSDIKGNYSYETNIKGVNGLMMEFETSREGKTYKMTALSVEPMDNLSDDLFKVPSDYQIMDMSNFQGGMKTK
ncbi:MAG TPA: DUF4412 domain-containing protein [Bacteroidia bacterium]|nr:DUF4412 domain-containing protein [Bacteroidota bacterium]MBK7572409.1 DUF4412 domain-containing protein [Bacteroidota bacterium]MBK8587164.1 DUF4412 domain-containing protein [Bacteroidota bacterium]HQW00167.1 DUF4412 domain-containing protein [Bacteroidia bacterium]HQW23396.1 DUF4412 domain-containing protein [Bacteroidia bacterium]